MKRKRAFPSLPPYYPLPASPCRLENSSYIPCSTFHRISQEGQQGKFKPKERLGRPPIATPIVRQKLVSVATASAHNRRLPYSTLTTLVGLRMSTAVIQKALQEEGFHRPVARQKPPLTPTQKSKRCD